MVRQYGRINAPAGGWAPLARPGSATDGRGLSELHWRLMSLVAGHGVLDTRQVTALMFASRPTAARHLALLVRAGLLVRFVETRDPTHLAHYEVSDAGAKLLARRLSQAGQPVPLGLGEGGHRDEETVKDFFVRLASYARRTGQGHLYRWRHALDTAAWLRSQGVTHVRASGYGMWTEDDLAVGFLLHIDGQPSLAMDTAPPPVTLLSGYQHAPRPPVEAVLVITGSDDRERLLHRDTGLRLPVRVAATTIARLHTAASPADTIWSVAGADSLMRLVDLGRAA